MIDDEYSTALGLLAHSHPRNEPLPLPATSLGTWSKDVLHSDLPVMVDFWEPKQEPYPLIRPLLREFAADHVGLVSILAVDIDDEWALAKSQRIQFLQTLVIYIRGRAVVAHVGSVNKLGLVRLLAPWMGYAIY